MKIIWLIAFIFVCQSYAQQSDFNHIDFRKADNIALALKNEKLDNLSDLSYNLTHDLKTDVEKFRAIYLWVCTNIENDYSQYLKNERKRNRYKKDTVKLYNWNNQLKQDVFKRLLKSNKTICTGYAFLVKKLADFANLDCDIVHGYGRTSTTDIEKLDKPNHTWNAIKLNDKWYLCDPTWASGIQNAETLEFTFQYNDGYFLAEPKLFAVNHFPTESKWLLYNENTPTFNDFLNAPVIYGNAYKNLKSHNTPKLLHNSIKKHETIVFEYELLNTIDGKAVSLLIDNGHNTKTIKPTTTTVTNTTLVLKHEFKTTGFYDVHLMINDEYISTYTFEVKS
jgi:transglutaminase/protease-like cytokinesis protein 3